ncbi:hypothetical protein Bca52824_096519, partial [Brassica carinata]
YNNSIYTMSSSNDAYVGDKNKSAMPQQEPCMPPEQDHYLPIASVTRIMRNILPLEATEANDICKSELRTTISAGDIISAMSKLGFEDYVEPLSVLLIGTVFPKTDYGCSLRDESSSFDPAYGRSGPYGYSTLDQSMVIGGGGRYYPNSSDQDGTTGGGGGSSSSRNGMPFCDHCDDGGRYNRRAAPTMIIVLIVMFTTLGPILAPPTNRNASNPIPGMTEAEFRVKQVATKIFWRSATQRLRWLSRQH